MYILEVTLNVINGRKEYGQRRRFSFTIYCKAKRLGFEEAVDIGSGDGRIAYCSKLLGMKSVGIEIDSALVDLQHRISNLTSIRYDILNEDATNIEYRSIGLSRPMFFIS